MEGDSMSSSAWAGPAAFFAQAGFPFPGLSNGFPGFPFGFPAHGFTGSDQSSERKMSIKPPHFMDSGFMSGGNVDFIKMATLVRFGTSKKQQATEHLIISSFKTKFYLYSLIDRFIFFDR